MRSTKDLKQIVSGQRAKSKLNGIAGSDYAIGNDDDADYATADSNKWDKKFGVTTEDNSKSDKEVIAQLTKELEDVKRKFAQFRRNYDSMSNN